MIGILICQIVLSILLASFFIFAPRNFRGNLVTLCVKYAF
jgi:hypothetical protein